MPSIVAFDWLFIGSQSQNQPTCPVVYSMKNKCMQIFIRFYSHLFIQYFYWILSMAGEGESLLEAFVVQ